MSFKELIDDSFVITGPLNSRKSSEIEDNANVALTFWWTETERQVRIQGVASKISEQLADKYFSQRNINAQAVSSVCEQGVEIDNIAQLKSQVLQKAAEQSITSRPKNWGGYMIKPIRIEFMAFQKTRFHDRKLYAFENGEWSVKQIQP